MLKLFIRSFLALSLLSIVCFSLAAPVKPEQAEQAARQWLAGKPQLVENGTKTIKEVRELREGKDVKFYLAALKPEGFILLSGDDELEPVLCFSGTDTFQEATPLSTLARYDLSHRQSLVRRVAKTQIVAKQAAENKLKWEKLLGALPRESLSDPRIDPLIKSRWSQSTAGNKACYNYYDPPGEAGSPYNFPCGCAATAYAQLMRYHRFPVKKIAPQKFEVIVIGQHQNLPFYLWTRGGDGAGGPYDWDSMPLVPETGLSTKEAQAIGALTYDAALTANTSFNSSGSAGYFTWAGDRLVSFFGYSQSHYLWTETAGGGLHPNFFPTVNSNLDAGYPVPLAIYTDHKEMGHGVICDGYGWERSTRYYHLNMGWSGSSDAWYNIPDMGEFTIVYCCYYNIFTAGTGQIVSGRVLGYKGWPQAGVKVSAVLSNGSRRETITDRRGIYAFARIPSGVDCTISATGYKTQTVKIFFEFGEYRDSGNEWNINLLPATGVGRWTMYE